MRTAAGLADAGEAFALATVVWRQGPSSGKQGSRALVTADGELRGWIGGACAEPTVIREATAAIADGQPRLLLLGPEGTFGDVIPEGMTVVPVSCASEGALEVYIEPVLPAPHLVVVGRSPMAVTLTRLAEALGWRAELTDGREFSPGQVQRRSLVVIATQGQADEDILARAITARPAYLGLVSSGKRGETVLGYLADQGVPKAQLDRVHVPAGLDLGRTSHEEMAVAILAQLVQLRAAGELASPGGATPRTPRGVSDAVPPRGTPPDPQAKISDTQALAEPAGNVTGGRRDLLPLIAPAEATDPVCGMTVPADSGHWPLEHDGVTDYFCCAGCRRGFEKSLAQGVKR
jgi:xanthine dehydrogenase accessory factor